MKRVSLLLLGIFFIGLFLCAVSVSFSFSLWFLRALLPENSGQYSVGYKNSFLEYSPEIKGIQESYANMLPNGVGNFNRFVYTKNGEVESIAGIPQLIHQFSLAQDLQAQSYTVRRIGWILLASKRGAVRSSNPFVAMAKTFGFVFKGGLPVHVQFVFQKNGDKDNTSNALYVEENRGSMHAVVHANSSEFVGSHAKRLQVSSMQSEITFVTLRRDTFPSIPSGFLVAVENKLSELMHFTKTHPRILHSLLSRNEAVILSVKESSVALGVVSTDDTTASLVQSWMHEEQGTRHPQKKAFALPDKSIGYEFIPGTSNAHFSLTKGAGTHCLLSEEYDESIFLCGKDDILVVSNEEHMGNQLVALLADSKGLESGVIQGGVLNAIGLGSQLSKIEYSTTGNVIDVWADGKTKD